MSESKSPLDRYAAKRSFARTPEPAPQAALVRSGPLLFVVQKHAARRLHYDFRLELDGVLKSWAVPKGPSLDVADKRMAVQVEDHPFEYASFEGVIPPRQYGAGRVIVWDCGVYSPDEDREYSFGDRTRAEARMRAGLEAGKLGILLRGEKLKGSFALVRTSTKEQWLLIKHRDRFADGTDVLARNRSVLCGATLDELSAERAPERSDAARLAAGGPAEELPAELAPMLAASGDVARSDPAWLFEPKVDGYRVIAFISGTTVRLQSRRGIDLTPFFPEIVADLAAQAVDRMIVDGEIVALGADGRPSFNALQNRAQAKGTAALADARRDAPAALVCFDLLHFAGVNLRAAPYADRHRYLAQCLLPSAHVQLVHVSENAEALYAAAIDSGYEGIVAKRKDGIYQPGRRSPSWLKIKALRSAEFVVGGYTRGKGQREALGALLLGYWEGSKLHYAGHVGSGLHDAALDALREQTRRLQRNSSPFAEKPPLHRPTTWLEPQLVAEVEFSDLTSAGLLRAPVFVRLREDIDPGSIGKPAKGSGSDVTGTTLAAENEDPADPVSAGAPDRTAHTASGKSAASEIEAVLEQLERPGQRLDLAVQGARIRLTHLERIYWPADAAARRPAITKRDFIRYLAAVSPCMLPHLKDRPLTMIRMPEGIDGERFFQKHWEHTQPDFVETVTVFSDHKSERHAYLLANNLPTLLWLGQSGTLEFHIWHSRASVDADAASRGSDYASSLAALEESILNYPDYLVFDIDPYIYSGKEAAGAEPELNAKGFATGKKVAFWLRQLLQQMSLEALVKTSGKTGLHVFVPIQRTVTFDTARQICEVVGRHVMREHPREITMEWAVQKRTGKIFIDYNMNVRGKTLNVAYSPRGVPGAPVSMPLTWDELEGAEPMDFRIDNVLRRLEKTGDRWHDALAVKQSLARAFGLISRDARTGN
ncbi:MAG TPA: non-homologous end-joining DNA ligase [Steroidobacteraceae bacterium]|nr:non-homologous end-joining DNA ligase [Steroidobacteraceae bacterium]